MHVPIGMPLQQTLQLTTDHKSSCDDYLGLVPACTLMQADLSTGPTQYVSEPDMPPHKPFEAL